MISAVNYRYSSGLVAAVHKPFWAPPCLWRYRQIRFAKGVALEASEHHPEEGESGRSLFLGYPALWDASAGGAPTLEGISHAGLGLPYILPIFGLPKEGSSFLSCLVVGKG